MWFLRLGLLVLLAGLAAPTAAQTSSGRLTPADFGFRRLVVLFGRDSVQVLVQSPKGQEHARKPLLLWAQGSLPRPVLLYDAAGPYGAVPFLAEKDRLDCHLVLISKPGIPLVGDIRLLDASNSFTNKVTHCPPPFYCQRNYLDYYVRRDEAVLRYLKKQPWVDKTRVIIGGHSEGSAVVAHLAAVPGLVSRVVYLSGSPLGRELTEVARNPADTTATGVEAEFADWQRAVDHPDQNDCTPGDSNKNIYSHGQSQLPFLMKVKGPIFVGYGTRDAGAGANDYLRLEAIRQHKTNFTFRAYLGREHNFFRLKANGQPNYDEDYWAVVGQEFLRWAGLGPVAK